MSWIFLDLSSSFYNYIVRSDRIISLQSLQDSAKSRYLDFGKESIWWFWCFKENYAPLCYLFISTTFSFINMERPNYKLQALINHCKSILELYDRSLCTQRFHRFANKRNVEHNLWWLSDWVAIRLTRYVVTRVTEKKYTAKIKSGKWGFTWMLSLYDYIYKKKLSF